MPKVSNDHPSTGAHQDMKDKKNIVEVFPIRMLATIKGHSLILSGPDGSQITIELPNCTVVAVSASNLPSRKWLVQIKVLPMHPSSIFRVSLSNFISC